MSLDCAARYPKIEAQCAEQRGASARVATFVGSTLDPIARVPRSAES